MLFSLAYVVAWALIVNAEQNKTVSNKIIENFFIIILLDYSKTYN